MNGIGAGGEQQPVVGLARAVVGVDDARDAVDRRDRLAERAA